MSRDTEAIAVTVAIVSHGNRDLLLGCLETVTADDQPMVEIIVLDNASEDGSADAVREAFPTVRVVEQAERKGFGANHNAISRLARGRYLFMLNDDTVVHPGTIGALTRFLDDHRRVAIAAPQVLTAEGSPYTFVLQFPTLGGAVRRVLWPWAPLPRWDSEEPLRVEWVNGCAMLVRRSAFDEVGGFDEGFFMYAEEKDLCRRLAASGWATYLVPGPGVVHYGEQSSGAVPQRRRTEFARSQRRYFKKHMPGLSGRIMPVLGAVADIELWLAAEALSRLPDRVRPSRMRPQAAAEYRRQALGALTRGRSPGLREFAEEWNLAHEGSRGGPRS